MTQFTESDIGRLVVHPKFGLGRLTMILGKRVQVLFEINADIEYNISAESISLANVQYDDGVLVQEDRACPRCAKGLPPPCPMCYNTGVIR